jgi:hypothetical protein
MTDDLEGPLEQDLEDFVYLKFDWVSASPALQEIANELSEQFFATKQRRSQRDMASAFNVVLTALEVQGAYQRPVRIVTDSEVYGGAYKRSETHTREVLAALRWLIHSSYLVKTDGRRIRRRGKHQTHLPNEYRLSETWLKEISSVPISKQSEILRNRLAYYVVIKAAKDDQGRKAVIPLESFTASEERALIQQTAQALKAYDAMMSTVQLTLYGEVIPSQRCSYTRIFNNGGLEDGGRFYAAIQSIKKEDRPHLKINGVSTVEIDYSELHPTMLYELEGMNEPGAYIIDGYDRDTVKIAFNILINRDATKHRSSTEVQSIANYTGLSKQEAEALRKLIYQKHRSISHRFNRGYGLKLQRLDSDIALTTMHHFTGLNVPFIHIHDAVIVDYRAAPEVQHFLFEAYNSVMQELVSDKTTKVQNAETGLVEQETSFPLGGGFKIKEALNKEEIEDLKIRFNDYSSD